MNVVIVVVVILAIASRTVALNGRLANMQKTWINVGDTLRLSCNVADPSYNVFWTVSNALSTYLNGWERSIHAYIALGNYREWSVFDSEGRYAVSGDGTAYSNLTVTNANVSETGLYKCLNTGTSPRMQMLVIVNVPESAMTATFAFATEGESVILPCRVDDDGSIVRWMRRGESSNSNQHFVLDCGSFTPQLYYGGPPKHAAKSNDYDLRIRRLQTSDSGRYICIADGLSPFVTAYDLIVRPDANATIVNVRSLNRLDVSSHCGRVDATVTSDAIVRAMTATIVVLSIVVAFCATYVICRSANLKSRLTLLINRNQYV